MGAFFYRWQQYNYGQGRKRERHHISQRLFVPHCNSFTWEKNSNATNKTIETQFRSSAMLRSETIRIFFLCLLHYTYLQGRVNARGDDRKINIENLSGSKVEVHWIHPQTDERVLQSSPFVYHGASFELNSFVTHTFEARELPGKTGSCRGEDQTCRIGFFTVNENDSQGEK